MAAASSRRGAGLFPQRPPRPARTARFTSPLRRPERGRSLSKRRAGSPGKPGSSSPRRPFSPPSCCSPTPDCRCGSRTRPGGPWPERACGWPPRCPPAWSWRRSGRPRSAAPAPTRKARPCSPGLQERPCWSRRAATASRPRRRGRAGPVPRRESCVSGSPPARAARSGCSTPPASPSRASSSRSASTAGPWGRPGPTGSSPSRCRRRPRAASRSALQPRMAAGWKPPWTGRGRAGRSRCLSACPASRC